MVTINKKKGVRFVVPRRDALITFPEGHEYEGAEIRAKLDVDVKTFLDLQALSDATTAEETREIFTKFGDVIITEWNLNDENNKSIPATSDGFMSLPAAICTAIITAWADEISTAGKV